MLVKNNTGKNVDIYKQDTHKSLQPGQTAELSNKEITINTQMGYLKNLTVAGGAAKTIPAPAIPGAPAAPATPKVPIRAINCTDEQAIEIMKTMTVKRQISIFLRKETRPSVIQAGIEFAQKL